MAGKDIQNVIGIASTIFFEISKILKANKKDGCELGNVGVGKLCSWFSNLCVLWDGAFSYAIKVNLTDNDIKQYERVVTATVKSHIAEGLGVTPKVHLMWKHIAQKNEVYRWLGVEKGSLG